MVFVVSTVRMDRGVVKVFERINRWIDITSIMAILFVTLIYLISTRTRFNGKTESFYYEMSTKI